MGKAVSPRRILMVHWDGAGNVPPQRALSRELVRRGHDVHVLSHDSLGEELQSDGTTFHRLGTVPQHSKSDRQGPEEFLKFLLDDVLISGAFAADFQSTADRIHPDVLLVDAVLLSVLLEARRRPEPCAVLCHATYDGPDSLMNQVMGLVPGNGERLTYPQLVESFPLLLVFSYRAFNPDVDNGATVEHVGPIREPVEAADWPRRHPDRPFVLVSLSTGFQNQLATLQRVCDGLAPLPLEVLVTTGPSLSASELTVSPDFDVRPFVAHDEVMPALDLIVTHGGHGTVMAGAGSGVPMLCIPGIADQPANARRVEKLGIGRALSADATPTQIGGMVMDMLHDRSLRAITQAFAAGVMRFGDLERAANLVESLP